VLIHHRSGRELIDPLHALQRREHSVWLETFGAPAPLKELQTKFDFARENIGSRRPPTR
jgi:hypothetical protein